MAGADLDGDLAVIEVPTGDIEPLEWADTAGRGRARRCSPSAAARSGRG